jgi:hypothetical protein
MDPAIGRTAAVLAGAATLALGLAHAQQPAANSASSVSPAAAATNETATNSAEPAPQPAAAEPQVENAEPPQAPVAAPGNVAAPAPPPGPPAPVRSSTAILRVLDKVTAETLRFEAPVGRRVRYKTLIFLVKACETRGPDDPLPRPSAYVVVDSEPPAAPGLATPEPKEIYRGWMFATAPGLHLFEHPVYDAWLESCTSATLAP